MKRKWNTEKGYDAAMQSDALVLFGLTGDLARKKIFPALYAMAKRGDLNVPVVGVARPSSARLGYAIGPGTP